MKTKRYGLLPVEVAEGPLKGRRFLMPVDEGEIGLEALVVEVLGGPDDGAEVYLEPGSEMDQARKITFGDWDRPDVRHSYRRDGNRLLYEGAIASGEAATNGNGHRKNERGER